MLTLLTRLHDATVNFYSPDEMENATFELEAIFYFLRLFILQGKLVGDVKTYFRDYCSY